MAGRKAGFRHNEDTRKKIQAAQLINRLYNHVMADQPLLDASQVNAAKALLNKVLPDLSAVELSGEVETAFVMRAPAPKGTAEEWQAQHSRAE